MMKTWNKNPNGLDPCLLIPIAAKSIEVIEKHVGEIIYKPSNNKWLVIRFTPQSSPNHLPVWDHPRATLLHQKDQLWVHVNYSAYSLRYRKTYPNENFKDYVIDHLYNRRLARVAGFEFIRVVYVSRGTNSSSGKGPEQKIFNLKDNAKYKSHEWWKNTNDVCYADPSDLLKILDIKNPPIEFLDDYFHLFY